MIKSWGFFDGNGNELTRGWQGDDAQARAQAQRFANAHGITAEAMPEGTRYDDNGNPPDGLIVCEPDADAAIVEVLDEVTVTDPKTGEEITDYGACLMAVRQDLDGTLAGLLRVEYPSRYRAERVFREHAERVSELFAQAAGNGEGAVEL